ncbi:serine hydrolase [Psychrobium sp. 1_MG-2023]|uniref:serine hydrolase domain-containing protein n=1 Tax=Psychrobium sp. 1_MG-2023 TaxID=3062624 RepID=UPI000C32E309|nr:serine hydrolase domain-containing protein [Psychrobium sp. 1_MG-2023]MDP2561370.1 serine hydrolase domain-containing protein [Psychrobium sp. 1_MG-2023]PKF54851.1 serine hydrolase [Alteromonadales bacterium alter-6D02]
MIKRIIFGGSCLFVSSVFAQEKNDYQEMLQCHADADKPGVAVWLEQSNKLVFSDAIGLANIETRQSLETAQVFQIGSASKQFTAAAVLQLIERDKLSLQSTLGEFIPSLPAAYSSVTIESVLSHTSGLPNYNSDAAIRAEWDSSASLEQVITTISQMPVANTQGEHYQYSNTGYVLLGKVIEVVSGMSFADHMKKYIFSPLQMNSSFVIEKGFSSGQVTGYSEAKGGANQFIKPMKVDRSWIHASGAIASTLEDMSRWHRAITTGQVVSVKNFKRMTTKAKLNSGEEINYGFGFDIYPIRDQHSISHQGWVPGFMTWSIHFPESDLYGVAFSNNDTVHPGQVLLDMIARKIQLSPRPINDVNIAEYSKELTGTYLTQDHKKMVIFPENDALFSRVDGGKKRALILREDNSFSYECTENYFQFNVNNGKAALTPVDIYRGKQPPLQKVDI